MSDIFDAILKIAHEFHSLGLEPPSIELADKTQGEKLLFSIHERFYLLPRHPSLIREEGDGSGYMHVVIDGLKIRWPVTLPEIEKIKMSL